MEICESIVLMYFQKGGVRATSVVRATTLSSWAVLCPLTRLLISTKASFSLPAVVSLNTEVYRSQNQRGNLSCDDVRRTKSNRCH
jgi:hypothetical protein